MTHYAKAQEGITKLKEAVYGFLSNRGDEGATNAEIGRALGIYKGYSQRAEEPAKKAQEGHVSRAILCYMESEEVVYREDKKWFIRKGTQRGQTQNIKI
jgi:hypothetical protein